MKQGTAKTLGVAALGVAFAAAGAGTASAAGLLPAEAGNAVKEMPLAGTVLPKGQKALDSTTGSVSRTANKAQKTPTVQKLGKSATKLLGGLPVGNASKGIGAIG